MTKDDDHVTLLGRGKQWNFLGNNATMDIDQGRRCVALRNYPPDVRERIISP